MAKRPVFVPSTDGPNWVTEHLLEFDWSPGFAVSQKKKNIAALHKAAAHQGITSVLEVSTKSDLELGVKLSAFNLEAKLPSGTKTTIECAFQGSKVFERGGPFTDLYGATSYDAKRDSRLRESGKLTGFNLAGADYSTEPKTLFYDWLYLTAITQHHQQLKELETFDGFTDIEFNPGKSLNCQARSCALYVALQRRGLLNEAISSIENFQLILSPSPEEDSPSPLTQGELF